MGQKNPIVVSSIDEALGYLGQFEGAVTFCVSPMSDRKGGGRPSWYVLRLDEDEDPIGWVKESEAEAEGKEWINFRVPTVDMEADDLPALPPSKANLWMLSFADGNGDRIAPRILIDPSADTAKPSAQTPRPRIPKAAPAVARVPSEAPAAQLGADVVLLQALQIQAKANQQMMAQVQNLLATVTGSIEQIGKGHAQLSAVLSDNLKNSEARAADAEKFRDVAIEANRELQAQVIEARSTGQFWLTLKEIYGAKPELLHEGMKDLVGGALSALRAGFAAADTK